MYEDMAKIEQVVVPKPFPAYCARKVHTAEWIEGEKLSQSTAADVQDLVNVGVVAYLTQLLETGRFHADPHPGNLIRTPEGKLCILDFGLQCEVGGFVGAGAATVCRVVAVLGSLTHDDDPTQQCCTCMHASLQSIDQITPDQRYGMVEAISHLVHRDYSKIGEDFQARRRISHLSLSFLPGSVCVRDYVCRVVVLPLTQPSIPPSTDDDDDDRSWTSSRRART